MADAIEGGIMAEHTADTWTNYAEALAFLGNSLLAPMNQTEAVGLDPAFWAGFPDFEDEGVAEAIAACASYAEGAQAFADEGGNAVQRVSVEYTKLFVGPPRPAAAPWETMHRSEGATVGFGEPTFAMQRLLRAAGLEVSNENNQYADHVGIELLYTSVLCSRAAEAVDAGDAEAQAQLVDQLASFVREHPLGWIDGLIAAVADAEPDGYIAGLLALAKAILTMLG